MMDALSISYLIAIGILFIGIEALTFSFVLFFFGLGFLIVAVITFFYNFEDGIVQIALASAISLILALILRKYFIKLISKPTSKSEMRTHVSGIGFIEDGMVKFDGTYWKTLDDLSTYKNGDKVEITNVVDNKVILKKEENL